jgi:hypothetical protein
VDAGVTRGFDGRARPREGSAVRSSLAFLALVLSSCSAPPPPAPPPAASAAPAPSAAIHPAPFTAEQLRAASRVGRTYVYRVEADGKPTVLREMRFTRVDAERAEVATTVKDEAGKVLDAKPPRSAAWTELRSHGEFPADRVTTAEEEVKVPAGSWKVTVFTVRGEAGEIERFYFAHDLAGPPVLFTTEKEGKRVMTSTLVEYRAGE